MNEKLLDSFAGIRQITVLTPGTYSRKIIVISTTWSRDGNQGQTAIKQVAALNQMSIKDYNYGFTTIKIHTSIDEAKKYHEEVVNSKSFVDCEIV